MSIQQIHLVRHGETSNKRGIVYGTRNFGLTPRGYDEAVNAGKHFAESGVNIGMVLSSPVVRARQTAQLFLEQTSYAEFGHVFIDDRLIETTSIFDGARVPEVAAKASSWKHLLNPYKPSWNEEYKVVASRMQGAVDTALSGSMAHTVLVGHQLPIWLLRLSLEGRPFAHDPASRQCGHASITTLVYRDKKLDAINYWANDLKAVRSS